jgi:hypothetical protein
MAWNSSFQRRDTRKFGEEDHDLARMDVAMTLEKVKASYKGLSDAAIAGIWSMKARVVSEITKLGGRRRSGTGWPELEACVRVAPSSEP